jgi:hypothetical protein
MLDGSMHVLSPQRGAWVTPLRVHTACGRLLTPAQLAEM